MKTKLKILIAASFLIGIIAIVSPAAAAGSNRIFFIASGDDIDDLPGVKDIIIGKIELGEGGELTTAKAQVYFHQKLHDKSVGNYVMIGRSKNMVLITPLLTFYCPVVQVYWLNCWWFQGEGTFKTTDIEFPVLYRTSIQMNMPNTGGKYITTDIFMWVSTTGAYCENNPLDDEPGSDTNPILFSSEGGWALTGVFWNVGIPMDVGFGYGVIPVGPASYFTFYYEY